MTLRPAKPGFHRGALAALAAIAWAPAAHAHLNSTGLGPFYDGVLHFVLSPEDLIPVLALALLAGLRGPDYGRRVLFVLPVAWMSGAALGTTVLAADPHPWISAGWFLLLGGLVAADARVSLRWTTILAALVGLFHGYANGTGLGRLLSVLVVLVGLGFSAFAVLGLVSAFVVRLRAPWARVAVRVAGSWIAACGLLLLGWSLRKS